VEHLSKNILCLSIFDNTSLQVIQVLFNALPVFVHLDVHWTGALPMTSSTALSMIPQYMHVMTNIRLTGKALFTVVVMDMLSSNAACIQHASNASSRHFAKHAQLKPH
jgi:hypothetical protein